MVLLMCLGTRSAAALDGQRSLTQYVHTTWGVDKGYIGGAVYAMAQSADGFLWLGTEHGLIRFDGFEFTLIQTPLADQRRIGAVRGLVEDADGTLWIRLDGPRLLSYRDGVFEDAVSNLSFVDVLLTAMSKDNANAMLLWGIQKQLLRFQGHRVQPLLSPDSTLGAFVVSITQSNTGSLWLGTQDSGLYRVDNRKAVQVLPDAGLHSINALVSSEHDGVWIGSDKGLHLWENGTVLPLEIPESLRHAQVFALVRDHRQNIWVGTDNGLYRIDSKRRVVTGFYCPPDGPRVSAIYEDNEGELWFAGSRSIERFRDGMFTAVTSHETALNDIGGPVFVDGENRTWFAPATGGLYCLENGSTKRIPVDGLDNDVVYSIDGGNGELWLGRQHGGLTELTYRNGQWVSQTFTQRDGLAQNSVYTVTRTHDGTVWVGTVSGGISVLRNGHFQTYTTNSGLPSNVIFSSLEAADKTMWFTSSVGLLSFDGKHWTNHPDFAVVPRLDLVTVFEDSDHVLWVGTSHGLARFDGRPIQVIHNLPPVLNEEILSIGQDPLGFLWVVTDQHVLQIDRKKLLSGTLQHDDVISYGGDDGLFETQGVRRNRSLVSDASGRIWISSLHSLAVADVAAATGYSQPERARIDLVSAEGFSLESKQNFNLPANTRSITFRYGGTNLVMPERTRFRYRLDGLDQSWSIGGFSRQVVFTPLSPGSYTFRIMASNALGVWNGPENKITFQVQPALWQTWYFRTLGVVLLAVLCVALYRFRLMQVTGQLNKRFQDRLAERTRIAQDLHDTLLQGVIATGMHLDILQDYLPEDSPAQQKLQWLLKQVRRSTEEGRSALRGLRTIDNLVRIETAFERIVNECKTSGSPESSVAIQGHPNPLKAVVYEEAFRIGREAYINSLAHASATQIEIMVEYGNRAFCLRIKDDGCGIDEQTLSHGREGHWGLAGMKERAKAIGADLSIQSHTPGGTTIDLRIPASIAYTQPNSHHFKWPWKLWKRSPK